MERAEFEAKAMEHMDALYRMAFHLSRRAEDASDLVQDTYLKALRSAASFEERGGGMKSWLMTILHHTFYTRIRRASRGPALVEEFYDADSRERIPDEPPPAWDLKTFDPDHIDERLKHALEELSDEHREVLLLWGVEGLKYREIADITGVPIGTVMSRLHRARKTLADSLEELASELGLRE